MLLLLIACTPAGPDPDAFVAPDSAGPYTAMATTLTWTDDRGVAMTAEVWAPSEDDCEPEPYPELPISGQACRDGDFASGVFPLVAFSHGNAGIRYQSIFLTEALAQHGYVVVAPDHPGNNLLDFDEARLGEVALARAGDVASAVNEVQALAGSALPDLVGTDYAVVGHSFGGWTSLAVGGGVVDLDGLRTFCADTPDYDFCNVVEQLSPDATSEDFSSPDPRVVSVIPLAAPGWYAFEPQADDTNLDGLPPTLVMGGTRDEGESPELEIEPLYARLPDPRAMAIIEGAGHYAFSDICLIGDLQPDCAEESDGYIRLDTAHTIINTLTLAWLGTTLRGDDRYRGYLGPIAPEVDWTE